MFITAIRYVDGKETRIEWTDDLENESAEHKKVSRQAPETNFVESLTAFVPLVARACKMPVAWEEGLSVTGLSFSEQKAKGGGTRMGVIVVCRYTPEDAFTSPIFLNTPLLREPIEDAEVGKAGFIPADWDDAIEEVKKQAIRFLQGKRFQAELPLAPAA
jgi:hypothetical protein